MSEVSIDNHEAHNNNVMMTVDFSKGWRKFKLYRTKLMNKNIIPTRVVSHNEKHLKQKVKQYING